MRLSPWRQRCYPHFDVNCTALDSCFPVILLILISIQAQHTLSYVEVLLHGVCKDLISSNSNRKRQERLTINSRKRVRRPITSRDHGVLRVFPTITRFHQLLTNVAFAFLPSRLLEYGRSFPSTLARRIFLIDWLERQISEVRKPIVDTERAQVMLPLCKIRGGDNRDGYKKGKNLW